MNLQKPTSGQDNFITSDDLLGKEVIDAEGEYLGITEKVLINSDNMDLAGISIDKGFLQKGLSIGKSYISRVTSHAIFLNIVPYKKMKNMRVFDNSGREVGKVTEIHLEGEINNLKGISVKTGIKKKYYVESKNIQKIGENIFLNIKYDKNKKK